MQNIILERHFIFLCYCTPNTTQALFSWPHLNAGKLFTPEREAAKWNISKFHVLSFMKLSSQLLFDATMNILMKEKKPGSETTKKIYYETPTSFIFLNTRINKWSYNTQPRNCYEKIECLKQNFILWFVEVQCYFKNLARFYLL